MKVGILGAGATGCNVGGHLKLGGAEVWFIDPYKAHMDAIAQHGLIWVEQDGTVHDPLFVDGAVTDSALVGVCDVVIILCKGPFTRAAVRDNPALFGEHTAVITLQNGVGNTEILREFFPPERIGYGVMYCGGTVLEPGKTVMLHSPVNVIFKRMRGGKDALFAELEEIWNKAGFPVLYTDDADNNIWVKLGVNCFCNMPCGITRINMFDLCSHSEGNALVESIVNEVVAVAVAQGFSVTAEEVLHARQMTLDTKSKHYPSGAQDIRNKKPTEVDFLNGAVVQRGKELGIPTPVNEAITRIAHVLQDTYDDQF